MRDLMHRLLEATQTICERIANVIIAGLDAYKEATKDDYG